MSHPKRKKSTSSSKLTSKEKKRQKRRQSKKAMIKKMESLLRVTKWIDIKQVPQEVCYLISEYLRFRFDFYDTQHEKQGILEFFNANHTEFQMHCSTDLVRSDLVLRSPFPVVLSLDSNQICFSFAIELCFVRFGYVQFGLASLTKSAFILTQEACVVYFTSFGDLAHYENNKGIKFLQSDTLWKSGDIVKFIVYPQTATTARIVFKVNDVKMYDYSFNIPFTPSSLTPLTMHPFMVLSVSHSLDTTRIRTTF